MKIEIEFGEVEALKQELMNKKRDLIELKEELDKLDPDKLKQKAVSLAKDLFSRYMSRVFEELGFEETYSYDDPFRVSSGTLEHWIGEDWYTSLKVEVIIGASISNLWRRAFLRFGIKADSKGE